MPKKIQALAVSVIFVGDLLLQVVVGGLFPHAAQAATTWWPDGNDVANDARATWVYFSTSEFTNNWSTTALVDASVLEMRNKKVDIIIASLTSTDMTGLSNAAAPRTVLYQRMVDQAASYGMVVYVGYWEDEFAGTSAQMSSYTAVDNVINFNNNNGAQTDITGVVSDYEMHTSNRTATRYAQWRQFHSDLKNRIGANSLKLIPVLNDPAVLINNCNTCDATWMSANCISGSNPNYSGDVNYFTSYNSVRFADAYIGLYYYSSPATIQSNAHDDIVEANGLSPAAPVIVGFSVGPNSDPTLLTETDVNTAVSNNEAERATYPNGTLGVMAWRWDDPTDGDAEYRDTISSQPPGGTATPTNTPSGPTSTPTPTVTPGGAPTMHVADMLTTDVNGTPKSAFVRGDKVYWRVKIVDQTGSLVSGASVTTNLVKPNGSVWTTLTSTTGADGWALFSKSTLSNSQTGTYTINVTGVTKTGVTYDPAANVKSSITFTLQ